MRWWHQFLFRLERTVHWREADQDLDAEIRSHIELETQDNIDRGMPPEQASRAAHIKFGSAALAKEDSRAVLGFLWAEQLLQDLRYGARILTKSPGFTATAVVSLALGIGATTAVFSIFDTIFLRPLPYPEPDRLVGIWERRLDMPEPDGLEMVSTPTFLDWKKQSQSYEDLHEVIDAQSVFNGNERAEQVVVRHVSEGYFHMMGARACQGRLLTPDDYAPGQPTRTVISYPTWQRLFGSNPSIVGSTIRVSGSIYHVVGVMCPDYRPLWGEKVDFWIRNWMDKRELRMWWIVGRLRPGISIEKAQAELNVIEARLAQQYPEQKGYGARIQSLQAYLYGYRKNQFLTFFGTVVLVLLIACVNVANLLLERGTSRGKEMAVRVSLGAGRSRLVRQMLTESLLLSVLGTVLGLVLAYAGVRLAVYISPEYAIPRADEISINVRMLGFTVLLTVLSAWSFGLFPALRASKPELTEFLKEGRYGPVARLGGRRVQSVLVIGQIALSLLLLVGAGLAIQNTWHVLHASFGFDTDHVAQMTILLPRFEYMEHIGDGSFARMKPKTALTVKSIEERLRAIPGVRAVSVTSSGVFSGCNGRPISAQGPPPRQDSGPVTCYEPVGPGYFGILEIPVLKGRVFTDWDSSNSPPVAVISQSVAGRFFPGQDPIGKIINIGIWESDDFERRQVVGVVADVRWSVNRDTHSAVYYPYSQLPAQFHWLYGDERLSLTFLARSAANPAALPRIMDRLVPEVARDVVISTTETVDSTRRSASRSSRFFTWLLATFAGTALLLAAVGIFGVMSYEVAGRTHEIGIRMALGAHPQDVLRLILQNGTRITSIGLVIGLAGALALARLLQNRLSDFYLYDVKPTESASLAAVCVLVALVALLACYIPARRAARMNPLTSLRCE